MEIKYVNSWGLPPLAYELIKQKLSVRINLICGVFQSAGLITCSKTSSVNALIDFLGWWLSHATNVSKRKLRLTLRLRQQQVCRSAICIACDEAGDGVGDEAGPGAGEARAERKLHA